MLKQTIERKAVGGQLALSAQAQFHEDSVKMTEYHKWVISENDGLRRRIWQT
jgi:hypothetical protein